jgi:hypothetical protein
MINLLKSTDAIAFKLFYVQYTYRKTNYICIQTISIKSHQTKVKSYCFGKLVSTVYSILD